MKLSRNLVTLIILILLLVALPVTIYLVRQTQIFRPKAAGETITFSLDPLSATENLNNTFNVDVLVNTNNINIDAVEFYLQTDSNLDLLNFQKSDTFNSEVTKDLSGNTLHYITTDTTQPRKIINGVVKIGTLQLRGNVVGVGHVTFTSGRANSNDVGGSLGSANNSTGTYTITSGSAVSPSPNSQTVSLQLSPSTATKNVGDSFDVALTLAAGSLDIGGLDITYNYDKNVLDLLSFTPSNQMPSTIQNTVDSNAGTLRFIATNESTNHITGDINLGVLHLRAKAIGVGNVTLGNNHITTSSIAGAIPTTSNINGTYTVTNGSISPSPSSTASPIVSITPSSSPQGGTKCYKIAEDPATLNSIPDSECLPYTDHPLVRNWTFADPTPGRKFIYVRYYSTDGRTSDANAYIDLVADPAITGCSFEVKGSTLGFVVNGNNFGTTTGSIWLNNSKAASPQWADGKIIATFPTSQFKDPGQTVVNVTLERSDKLVAFGKCSNKANSVLSLGAKLFCPQVTPKDISGVDLKIVEATTGGQIVFNGKVNLGADGVIKPQNSPLPFLKENFGYRMAIKVPKGVRQVLEFIGQAGTTNIIDFTVFGKRLALGDIAPQGGDGVINTLDKSELNTEWNLTKEDSGRAGDLNSDSRVNSVDWACMRYDFDKSDAPDPTPGPLRSLPQPTPTPSVIFNNIINNESTNSGNGQNI